ncbi:MAG: Homing endonuclease [candidate division CPR2 bacterium GW2011_GWC1_39_9]|uniref:Homing endonuclease n=1 Tax=candidate division CPR2 bacterium GW2011_GWC2_39_10 TaxID=1618345 RepID=A0A0G0LP85_UNCC2|nr:MAG: Homing endonuclease [candidate division CPR2 bacterium GW2011_GWC2_39_10]KKR28633.1 MAG: Homing endonuclease [candidate division CPR2 bacterium GW2011_GWD1_39_7]KKR35160.1 MAG: Homing endonuclease [candidate division CPR2 bacterium GW2011_GWC1_39_9]OGB61316.1 MAG: hypothetical protein A2Y27_02655 [candidate division CPR2 bacterium GWD1_39_7]
MQKELLSYIAGFLDGDGCIMAQLVHRKDYRYGYQIRLSIVFYQKEQKIEFLEWLKTKLKYGYIRNRNDGMAEYTIVGPQYVQEILIKLLPYLRLKRKLAELVLEISRIPKQLTAKEFLQYAELVDLTAKYTYSKKRTRTKEVVENYLKEYKILSP